MSIATAGTALTTENRSAGRRPRARHRLPPSMQAAESSYVALRAHRSPETAAWWDEADRSNAVPPPVAAFLAGRTRLELSVDEADAALHWAATLASWADAEPKPLRVHMHDPVGDLATFARP
jgi:hypothetical protein